MRLFSSIEFPIHGHIIANNGLYDALLDETPRELSRMTRLLNEPGFFDHDFTQMIRDPADTR